MDIFLFIAIAIIYLGLGIITMTIYMWVEGGEQRIEDEVMFVCLFFWCIVWIYCIVNFIFKSSIKLSCFVLRIFLSKN
jgi:hypothetical protein